MEDHAQDNPGVIAMPPVLFLVTLVLEAACHFIAPVSLPPWIGLRFLGVLLAVIAGTIALSAQAQMLKAGTNIRPDRPATVIVSGGPYRFTRNPMYLSLCMLNCGIGLLLGDLIPLVLTVVFGAVLHYGVILREERYLQQKFGDEYLAYCRRVRRWI